MYLNPKQHDKVLLPLFMFLVEQFRSLISNITFLDLKKKLPMLINVASVF